MNNTPNAAHAHIPKRATQHAIFLDGSETAPPSLKPGQSDLYRQDLYVNEARPLQDPYLLQDQIRSSTYIKDMSSLLPEDYVNRTTPYTPPTVTAHSHGDDGGTSHWKSEYQASSNKEIPEEVEFGRPPKILDDDYGYQSMLTRGTANSSYQEEFGKYGSDPRDKILPNGITIKKDLDHGTTKGTFHTPGYQGYIPSSTCLAEVARVANGEVTRSVDKTNIDQTFHTNLIGYAGHEPRSARNDNGGRQPTLRTVYGRDFRDPATLQH